MFPNDTSSKIAGVHIKTMFSELASGAPSFAYEAGYWDASALVHSTVRSLGAILPPVTVARYFDLSLVPQAGTASRIALGLSAVALLWGLGVLNEYAGLGLDDCLSELREALRQT